MEVVACAVTFGTVIAQLGAVTIKFKNLWDEIAGVPDRIAELVEEMDIFRMLFAQMETSIKDPDYPNLPPSFWTGPLMQISLNRAKQALTALESVTRELDDKLKTQRKGLKRTIVAIRGLMNKEKIQGLERRFEKAIQLLKMSYDLSSKHLQDERMRRHVTQQVAHTIKAEMAIAMTAVYPRSIESWSTTDTDEPSYNDSRRVASRNLAKAQARPVFRWRLPSWWSTTVWEVCSAPQPGWNYGLRVYNMVPDDSPILQSILNEDAEAITELFRSRRASPFDRDEENRSLLKYAIIPECSLKVVMAILEWSPAEAICEGWEDHISPLHYASFWSMYQPDPDPAYRELLQLSWSLGHDVYDIWHLCDQGMSIVDERLPTYHDTSIRWKCIRVRYQAYCDTGSELDSSWISADGTVQPAHIAGSIAHGLSLIHSAAIRLAFRSAFVISSDYDDIANDQFTQDIIKASTPNDLHHLEAPGERRWYFSIDKRYLWKVTPLIFLIGSIATFLRRPAWNPPYDSLLSPKTLRHVLKRAVYAWADNLRRSGVDLTTYGCKERSLLHANDGHLRGIYDADDGAMAIRQRPDSADNDFMWPLPIWLIDLKYGAKPEDWDLIFVIEFEAMARDFWELIEEQAFTGMPGSWVE